MSILVYHCKHASKYGSLNVHDYMKLRDKITAQIDLPLQQENLSSSSEHPTSPERELINEADDKYRNFSYRPPKPKSFARCVIWDANVENLYRYQNAGYHDKVHYWIAHKDTVKLWNQTGFIKSLPHLKHRKYVHYGPFRECTQEKLYTVRIYDYSQRFVQEDHTTIEMFVQKLMALQNAAHRAIGPSQLAQSEKPKKKDGKAGINSASTRPVLSQLSNGDPNKQKKTT